MPDRFIYNHAPILSDREARPASEGPGSDSTDIDVGERGVPASMTVPERETLAPTPDVADVSDIKVLAEQLRSCEQALQASEARFQRLANALPQFLWECDARGQLVYVNQRWIDYSGFALQSSGDAERLETRIHPQDRQALRAAWENALRNAAPLSIEARIQRHDDVYRSFLIRAEPVIENDVAVRWYGTSTDITEIKDAQQQIHKLADDLGLRLQEQETLLSALPVGVFIAHDPQCSRITMNPAGAAMLRLPAHINASKTGPQSSSLGFRVFAEGVEVPNEDLPMQRATRTGKSVIGVELELVFDDDTSISLFEHARPLFDAEGRVRGCVGVFVDITQQKTAEEALREAGRRKDEFLATLAHELRNPLAALAAASHLLAKANDKPAVAAMARDALSRQIDHMAHLLDDLLDVARITRGHVQLRIERLDLGSIISETVATVQPLLQKKNHRPSVTLPRDPLHVNADKVRLNQIIGNLLSNASRYTDPAGTIDIRVEREQEWVCIAVRDTGMGIAPHMLEEIFEMFVQVTPALQRSDGGLGIGLSLVRGLAHLHGGTVAASSEGLGRGSEFVVRLPLARVPDTAGQPMQSTPAHGTSHRALRILVADDNVDSASSWAALLEMAGHDVRVAHDGGEALSMAQHFQPELTLLDIGMPVMNGYEVAAKMRLTDWGARAVIVALTGWGQEQDKENARAAGFDHHYTKPINMSVIEPILNQLQDP